MNKVKKEELDIQERVLILAEKVKLLFAFCGDLIPDKDLLRDVAKNSQEKVSTGMAMAPIIGAFGGNWEAVEFDTKLKARRADALFNLINVLDETEKERGEFETSQKEKAKGQADLARILGSAGLI